MNEIIDKLKRDQERRAVIASDYEYMDWLEKFTQQYGVFETDGWIYKPSDITEADSIKIGELGLFYEALCPHAKRNYIPTQKTECGEYLVLNKNDFCCAIGFVTGKRISFYAKRLNEKKEGLDFELAMNNKMTERAKRIDDQLFDLGIYMLKMMYDDIPIEAIEEKTNSVLTLVKKNKR